jgi:hypothetical protein
MGYSWLHVLNDAAAGVEDILYAIHLNDTGVATKAVIYLTDYSAAFLALTVGGMRRWPEIGPECAPNAKGDCCKDDRA